MRNDARALERRGARAIGKDPPVPTVRIGIVPMRADRIRMLQVRVK